MGMALGLIETVGLSAAAAALDAAADTADVKLAGYEKVIGVGKSVSVTINLVGEVASVQAAVEYGVKAAEKVGTVLSSKVIPRPHEDVDKLIDMFNKNIKKDKKKEVEKKQTDERNENEE
ncbi:BMC domain-containing protein [Anaeromicrobium sediminis]|uniref:Microcompartment protein n=1 Tax=Anaeromicrobium sediminis TaxID=1478221 RepID=A0A267MJU7_9FIRM|nr:BMC domain-containing protein [Anaeromicrobium sediminis]PAB59727.1 microcompartment protein [Anaeromicrobium sediminis]